MIPRDPFRGRTVRSSFWGGAGRAPRDLLAILAVLFITFSVQILTAGAFSPGALWRLQLGPLVWRQGWLWQVATYPFIGYGPPSLWFLVELLVLFWFGRDVFAGLGRRHFWRLLAWGAGGAALAALVVDLAMAAGGAGGQHPMAAFPLLQGQRVLTAIAVAAFATANRRATIYLFFLLPIEARWFILVEILIAFVGFLGTRDLAGFAGICAAVGLGYLYVRDGGIGRGLRQTRLRVERWWLQLKLDRARRKRGLHVVRGDQDRRGPWVS